MERRRRSGRRRRRRVARVFSSRSFQFWSVLRVWSVISIAVHRWSRSNLKGIRASTRSSESAERRETSVPGSCRLVAISGGIVRGSGSPAAADGATPRRADAANEHARDDRRVCARASLHAHPRPRPAPKVRPAARLPFRSPSSRPRDDVAPPEEDDTRLTRANPLLLPSRSATAFLRARASPFPWSAPSPARTTVSSRTPSCTAAASCPPA